MIQLRLMLIGLLSPILLFLYVLKKLNNRNNTHLCMQMRLYGFMVFRTCFEHRFQGKYGVPSKNAAHNRRI